MVLVSFSHKLSKVAGTGGEMGGEGLDLLQAISAPVLGFSNHDKAKVFLNWHMIAVCLAVL